MPEPEKDRDVSESLDWGSWAKEVRKAQAGEKSESPWPAPRIPAGTPEPPDQDAADDVRLEDATASAFCEALQAAYRKMQRGGCTAPDDVEREIENAPWKFVEEVCRGIAGLGGRQK